MPTSLRHSFEQVAELYDRARPSYPDELIDAVASLGSKVLEIGCGTGKASVALAARGCRLTCIEPGEQLGAIARGNLSAFPDAEVVPEDFESWGAGDRKFDTVFAISAWHWIDPAVGYAKAASLLRPGGAIAIVDNGHAFPEGFDPFFSDIQPTYDEIGESHDGWPPPSPDEVPDRRTEMEETRLFYDMGVTRYIWSLDYGADEYIDLLRTYSGHIAMENWKQDRLYGEIRRLMGGRRIRKHYLSILQVGRIPEA